MQANLENIKNIIFDLGNVIVNLDLQKTVNRFYKLGLDHSIISPEQEYADNKIYDLEVGNITPIAFRDEVRKILGDKEKGISDGDIDEAWSAMLLDTPAARVELLKSLGEKYNLYLFSNTNQLHIESYLRNFKEEFGFEFPSLFKKVFYSHEINDRKPNIAAFEKVIKLADIKPEETLFVDDLEANIKGAKQIGIKGYWLKEGVDIVDIFK